MRPLQNNLRVKCPAGHLTLLRLRRRMPQNGGIGVSGLSGSTAAILAAPVLAIVAGGYTSACLAESVVRGRTGNGTHDSLLGVRNGAIIRNALVALVDVSAACGLLTLLFALWKDG